MSQIGRDVAPTGFRTHVPSHSKRCYPESWGIACSTNRKNRVLRVHDLSLHGHPGAAMDRARTAASFLPGKCRTAEPAEQAAKVVADGLRGCPECVPALRSTL